jgi:hypothetical protein
MHILTPQGQQIRKPIQKGDCIVQSMGKEGQNLPDLNSVDLSSSWTPFPWVSDISPPCDRTGLSVALVNTYVASACQISIPSVRPGCGGWRWTRVLPGLPSDCWKQSTACHCHGCDSLRIWTAGVGTDRLARQNLIFTLKVPYRNATYRCPSLLQDLPLQLAHCLCELPQLLSVKSCRVSQGRHHYLRTW